MILKLCLLWSVVAFTGPSHAADSKTVLNSTALLNPRTVDLNTKPYRIRPHDIAVTGGAHGAYWEDPYRDIVNRANRPVFTKLPGIPGSTPLDFAHEGQHCVNNDVGSDSKRFNYTINTLNETRGFYLGKGKGMVVVWPSKIRSETAVPFVPSYLQGTSFDLYVSAKRSISAIQDREISTLFNELSAYTAGVKALLHYPQIRGEDSLRSMLESVVYALAACQVIQRHGNGWFEWNAGETTPFTPIKDAAAYLIEDAMTTYWIALPLPKHQSFPTERYLDLFKRSPLYEFAKTQWTEEWVSRLFNSPLE